MPRSAATVRTGTSRASLTRVEVLSNLALSGNRARRAEVPAAPPRKPASGKRDTQRETGRSCGAEADKDEISGHVGHKDVVQSQEAHRIEEPADDGQNEEQARQRPVVRQASSLSSRSATRSRFPPREWRRP